MSNHDHPCPHCGEDMRLMWDQPNHEVICLSRKTVHVPTLAEQISEQADKVAVLTAKNAAMEAVLSKIGKHFGVAPGDVDGLFAAIEASTDEDSL